MKEITKRDLFGISLKQLEGVETIVTIVEKDGSETKGTVSGYSAGGYKVKDEVIPAAVQIQNGDGLLRIKIEDIEKIIID